MKLPFRKITFLLGVLLALVHARTDLAGNIGGMTLDKSGNPFVVENNLNIPADKSVFIREGCVFLFKPFTGIIVDGFLTVEGTLEEPVVFTCINDTSYNREASELPNPFDWNGILITPQAKKVKLSNFILEYSVYGIKSQKEELVINNGTFRRNGQFHVTINDTIKPVVENIPFNLVDSGVRTAQLPVKNSATWVPSVALGMCAAGAAGLGMGAYFLYTKSEYTDDYRNATTQSAMDHYIKRQKASLSSATVTGTIGALLLPAGVAVYLWQRYAGDGNVSIVPGPGNGILFALDF